MRHKGRNEGGLRGAMDQTQMKGLEGAMDETQKKE